MALTITPFRKLDKIPAATTRRTKHVNMSRDGYATAQLFRHQKAIFTLDPQQKVQQNDPAMKTLPLLLTFMLFIRNGLGTALPQIAAQGTAPTVAAPATASSTAANSDIAYETATLPDDRLAAWEMLGNANGLHDDHLKPWSMRGHYTTYDTYGKKKADGTIEFVWATPDRWFVSYTEGGSIWQTWKTNTGTYTLQNQPALPYPEDRILPALRNPLTTAWRSEKVPEYIGMQKISNQSFLCFSNQPLPMRLPAPSPPILLCSDTGKPFLRLAAGEYTLLLNQIVGFQHHLVAEKLNMMFGPEPVFDVQVDALQRVGKESAAKLDPVAGASLISAEQVKNTADPEPGHVTAGHLVKKPEPVYPEEAKGSHIQGTVLLSGRIGRDGKMTLLDVLESPSPLLSNAAEDAVKHWVYEPYLLNGKPVEIETQVHVTFVLNR